MLLSISTCRLDLETPLNFLLHTKGFDVNVDNTQGKPFWMFAREREEGTVRVWAFGLHIIICRKQPGESWGQSAV